jgi:hypothetical protein
MLEETFFFFLNSLFHLSKRIISFPVVGKFPFQTFFFPPANKENVLAKDRNLQLSLCNRERICKLRVAL